MSRPLIRSGQWSQTTTGITQPAARLKEHALFFRLPACRLQNVFQTMRFSIGKFEQYRERFSRK